MPYCKWNTHPNYCGQNTLYAARLYSLFEPFEERPHKRFFYGADWLYHESGANRRINLKA